MIHLWLDKSKDQTRCGEGGAVLARSAEKSYRVEEEKYPEDICEKCRSGQRRMM